MNIIIDGRPLDMYPFGRREGFRGGTETYATRLAAGLAARGHVVHVVTPDLAVMEQRQPTEFWWPPRAFPTEADCVIAVHSLEAIEPYSADLLVLAPNGADPWLGADGSMATGVDAFACCSQTHIDLLCKLRPTVDPAKCHVTGLGVDPRIVRPAAKTPGRMLYANDPARGLWSLLEIFDHVRRKVPTATLHIAYDFDRQFENHRWGAHALAELLWECKERLQQMEGVTSVGALTREELAIEQAECAVHCMPSDPPNVGTQLHGITQMECAMASAALVLSDVEAFPEIFDYGATILPIPGKFLPQASRRFDCQDWAEVVVELMEDDTKWHEASARARANASRYTWDAVIDRWDAMLARLQVGVKV